jgi:hypothetical protein
MGMSMSMDDGRSPVRIGPTGERRKPRSVIRPIGTVRPRIRIARPIEKRERLKEIEGKTLAGGEPEPPGKPESSATVRPR